MTAGVDLSTIPVRSIPAYDELSYDDYLVCPRSQILILGCHIRSDCRRLTGYRTIMCCQIDHSSSLPKRRLHGHQPNGASPLSTILRLELFPPAPNLLQLAPNPILRRCGITPTMSSRWQTPPPASTPSLQGRTGV